MLGVVFFSSDKFRLFNYIAINDGFFFTNHSKSIVVLSLNWRDISTVFFFCKIWGLKNGHFG